ncbi:MAG: hypothetical protein Rubg2KO_27930 [Rubricoccaceae bacterium]
MTFAFFLAPFLFFAPHTEAPTPQLEADVRPPFELVGSVRYSDWSKTSLGDMRTELQAPGLLQTVELGERGDKPCFVKATFLRTSGSGTITRTLDECGNRGPTSRSRVTLGNVSSSSSPTGIYSIQACITDNQRLKGLRLERKNILFASNGLASSGQEYRKLELKRTNCSLSTFGGWDNDAPACPTTSSGTPTYAMGLGLALRRGSLYNVRLMCKEVRRTNSAPARRGRLGRN